MTAPRISPTTAYTAVSRNGLQWRPRAPVPLGGLTTEGKGPRAQAERGVLDTPGSLPYLLRTVAHCALTPAPSASGAGLGDPMSWYKVVEYERGGVHVQQTTEVRPAVAALLVRLKVDLPPKIHGVTPGQTATPARTAATET